MAQKPIYVFSFIFHQIFVSSLIVSPTVFLSELTNNGTTLNGIENFIVTNATSATSFCGVDELFGGYNIFSDYTSVQRIVNLPNHFRLLASFNFFIIDKLVTEKSQVFIDNVLIISLGAPLPACNIVYYYTGESGCAIFLSNNMIAAYFLLKSGANFCGTSLKDFYYRIEVQIQHTSPNVSFVFNNTGGGIVGAFFGISHFQILIESTNSTYGCAENCALCVSGVCKTCFSSNYYIQDSYCVTSCRSGYSANSITKVCFICHTSCLTCDGDTPISCLSCQSGKYLSGGSCLNCNSSCLTCDISTGNCSSCDVSLGLYLDNGICRSSCPDGTFMDSINFVCNLCDSTCLTCNGSSASNCLSCHPIDFLFGFKCLSSCPSNKYFDIILNQCISCDSSCLTCSSVSSTSCTSCDGSLGLFLNNGSCVTNCPNGKFKDSVSSVCSLCDSSCQTCLDSITCLSCSLNHFLSSNVCLKCDASCLTCTSSASNCLSCQPGLFKKIDSCVTSCSSNDYIDLANMKCIQCDASCKTCNGSNFNDCLSCFNPYTLDSENKCTQCNESSFYDPNNEKCIGCNSNCRTCFGQSESQCLSCNSGFILNNDSCVTKCPSQTFYDNLKNICSPCFNSCDNCFASGNSSCLSCSTGTFFFENSCLFNCPNGTLANNQNGSCDYSPELFCKITEIDNPYQFLLTFYPDVYSGGIYQNLINNISISIENDIKSIMPNFTINISDGSQSSFLIKIFYQDYNFSNDNNSLIKIKIQNVSGNVNFNEKTFPISLKTFRICSNTEYYNEKTLKCHEKIIITYSWMYSNFPHIIDFTFTQINNQIIQGLSNNLLNFDIPKLSSLQDYNYSLHYHPQANSFSFILESNKSIVGGMILNVIANKSLIRSINIFNNTILLIEKNFTIKLMENYIVPTETKELINYTADASEIGFIAGYASLYIGMLNQPGTSFVLKGLILSYLIKLLRYTDINYPPNSVAIFKKTRKKVLLINDLLENPSNIEIPKICVFYGIKTSFLNNIEDDLLQLLIVASFCIVFKFLKDFTQAFIKAACVISLFNKLELFLVWNILISIFFTRYIFFCFNIGVAFKFPGLKSSNYDFISFLIIIIYVVIFPLHLIKITAILKTNFILPLNLNNDVLKKKNQLKTNKIMQEPAESNTLTNSQVKKSKVVTYKEQIKAVVNWGTLKEYQTPQLPPLKSNQEENLDKKKEQPIYSLTSLSKNLQKDLNFWDFSKITENLQEDHNLEKFTHKNSKNDKELNLDSITRDSFGFKSNLHIDLPRKTVKNVTLESFKKRNNLKVLHPQNCEEINNENLNILKNISFPSKKKKITWKWETSPLFIPNNIENYDGKNVKENLIVKKVKIIFGYFKKIICFCCYEIKDFNKFKNKYKILWKDIKLARTIQIYYFTFYLFRLGILGALSAIIFENPLIQIILMCTVNLIFGIYIFTARPFNSKFALNFTLFNELCINLSYFSSLIIGIQDRQQNQDIEIRMNLGWMIVLADLCLIYSIVIYSFIMIIKNLVSFILFRVK